MTSSAPPVFTRSTHLVELIAEVERLAAVVAAVPDAHRAAVADELAGEAARATLALDGADAALLPELATARDHVAALAPRQPGAPARTVAARRGTWLDTLRVLEDPADDDVRALEVVGVHAANASDDLVDGLATDPQPALGELHRRLTRGLVDDARAGRARTSELAVHDASTGRVLFFPVEPHLVPGELALTAAWLASTATREHGLIVSGVLHHELLRIQPFDAANGRLARAAARLVLRGRGLDPGRLAVPEPALDRDRLGYHEEVAKSLRRRDLTIWLERWGEAVADGLRHAARRLGALDAEPAPAAAAYVDGVADFDVAEYRAELTATPAVAREQLAALLDAGRIRRVPGSRGLRFTTVA